MSSYPRPDPFQSLEEIRAYLNQQRIDCLLCGKRLKSLATHLAQSHEMTTRQYKEMYCLPLRAGLTSAATTEKLKAIRANDSAEVVAARISHVTSPDCVTLLRASKPAQSAVKRLVALQNGAKARPTPRKYWRDDALKVVEAIESGEMLYPYLERTKAMGASTFKTLLREFPDLGARYQRVAGVARAQALIGNSRAAGNGSRLAFRLKNRESP